MDQFREAYISRELLNIFGEYSLLTVNKVLAGPIEVDFHFKKPDGTHVFIEVSARKIKRTKLGSIMALYSAIASLEPPLLKFELIMIGPDVVESVKKELEGLPIKIHTYAEMGINSQKLRETQGDKWQQQDTELEMIRLSPDEAKLVANWEAEKKSTIRAFDVEKALNCSPNRARVLLHNLERKKWVERITRGLYQFIPLSYGFPEKIPPSNAITIGAALIEPYYFSYYTSNSHHGFITQLPFTFFIATTKKKRKIDWMSSTFQFVTLAQRKFFGYRRETISGIEVNIAEPEKSLVDSLDKPKYIGGIEQLVRTIWRGIREVNHDKLVDYAIKMKSHALVQRLGFIIDFLVKEGLSDPLTNNLRKKLQAQVGKSAIYLDSHQPKTGKFEKDWRIIKNIPKPQILSEIEIR